MFLYFKKIKRSVWQISLLYWTAKKFFNKKFLRKSLKIRKLCGMFLVWGVFATNILGLNTVVAINVTTPPSDGYEDITITWPTRVDGEEKDLFALIQLINQYLWFTIWVVCFALFLYGGFKLITARGDEWGIKTAMNISMGSGIGILISVFSYLLVRLVVNLL